MSYHFLCKRGIRPARTEQFLVNVRFKGFLQEQARLLSVVSLVMERVAPEVGQLTWPGPSGVPRWASANPRSVLSIGAAQLYKLCVGASS